MPGAFVQDDSIIKTPQTESHPSHKEMHPSKAHQSTAKELNSCLDLGFIEVDAVKKTPTKSTIQTVNTVDTTQSKPATPNFDFKWNRADTILSPEAQKIMESVREQAAKIKLKMQAERDEQARKDVETAQMFGVAGRKIAQPKGRSGRYSDVHKQEFKKMDSIAGHISAWKNKFQASSMSLKRSNSKARLGDAGSSDIEIPVAHKANINSDSGRLENNAPGKRVKQRHQDDVSSGRPVSRDSQLDSVSKLNTSGIPRSKSGIPSTLTTPTKASLARAASVKYPQTTKIPMLGRSKSFKEFTSPSGAKSEGSNKHFSSLNRLGNMKSILHKPNHKYSDDPVKIAEGTHLPAPAQPSKVYINKELPGLPAAFPKMIPSSPSMKQVNFDFTPNTKSAIQLAAASPSPSKIPALRSPTKPLGATKPADKITYPQLSRPGPLTLNPTQPGDFTFRSTKTINVGPANFGLVTPTIRQVRPSGIATPLAAFEHLPNIPHGMPNKKRRRTDSDDEEVENIPPHAEHEVEGPKAKRLKSSAVPEKGASSEPSVGEKRRTAAQTTKPAKGRGILSLSRLNMLARPKNRR